MAQKISPSSEALNIIDKLHSKLWWNNSLIGSVAIALSLNKYREKDIENHSINNDNRSFNKYSILWEWPNELFYKTIFDTVYNKKLEDDEFFSNNSIVKNHLESWLKIMNDLFIKVNEDDSEFLRELLKIAEKASEWISYKAWDLWNWTTINQSLSNNVYPIDIEIWSKQNWEKIILNLNDTQKHWNSHLAIMGIPWSWKTQLLMNILCQIKEQTNNETNIIFFDYKWDTDLHHPNFVRKINPKFFDVPDDKVPINPFILNNYDEKNIKYSAREKLDTFWCIDRWFWPNQRWDLYDAILACYDDRLNQDIQYPDFNELYTKIRQKKWSKNDTLTEIIRMLADFSLFPSHWDDTELFNTIYNKTFIVSLNKLSSDSLKHLVVSLIIEKIRNEMRLLPNSEVKDGHRQIRTILVIDEAHNYLPKKNQALREIIREWRSKWIVVFFASQSPNDYEQDDFNFRENLEFSLVLKCNELNPSSISKLIWCNISTAKELQNRIPNFETFQCLIKASEERNWYVIFNWEPFYKKYSK